MFHSRAMKTLENALPLAGLASAILRNHDEISHPPFGDE
jgi:hypothetical protein